MAAPAMKPRSIKVPDKLWEAALEQADRRQETLSEQIRRFLEQYIGRG